VIATLDIAEVTEPGTITAAVNATPSNPGIDRRWQFDAGDANVSGELALYYRNDVESCCFPMENRFVSDAAVRDGNYSQWDLEIVWEDESGELTTLETRINPYSNKVSADVSLRSSMNSGGIQWIMCEKFGKNTGKGRSSEMEEGRRGAD
jgi:spore coat protein H